MSIARIRELAGDLDDRDYLLSEQQIATIVATRQFDVDGVPSYNLALVASDYCKMAAAFLSGTRRSESAAFRTRASELVQLSASGNQTALVLSVEALMLPDDPTDMPIGTGISRQDALALIQLHADLTNVHHTPPSLAAINLIISRLLENIEVSGGNLVITRQDGSTFSRPLPAGGDAVADGSVASFVADDVADTLTLTLTTGQVFTVNLSGFIADSGISGGVGMAAELIYEQPAATILLASGLSEFSVSLPISGLAVDEIVELAAVFDVQVEGQPTTSQIRWSLSPNGATTDTDDAEKIDGATSIFGAGSGMAHEAFANRFIVHTAGTVTFYINSNFLSADATNLLRVTNLKVYRLGSVGAAGGGGNGGGGGAGGFRGALQATSTAGLNSVGIDNLSMIYTGGFTLEDGQDTIESVQGDFQINLVESTPDDTLGLIVALEEDGVEYSYAVLPWGTTSEQDSDRASVTVFESGGNFVRLEVTVSHALQVHGAGANFTATDKIKLYKWVGGGAAPGGGGNGLTAPQALELIKPFARVASEVPPTPGDLADASAVEVGHVLVVGDAPGNARITRWSALTNTGFHGVITVAPTPAQIAVGGNLARNGGVVFVKLPNKPIELWVRFSPALTLVKFITFDDHIVRPNAAGRLPAAADNINRIGLSGNALYLAVGEQGRDKDADWENYGPTRVVGAGEPAKSNDELLYAGSFANPPVGNYVLNAWAWDRGSEVWIRNQVHNGAAWVSSVGPPEYHHGNLYPSRGDALVHIPNATYVGRVYIIGHGNSQKPEIVTGFTPPAAPFADWIRLGLTPGQANDIAAALDAGLQGQITQNTQGLAAEAIARASADAALQVLIDALTGGTALTIGPYSDSATYVAGSSNSMVTHGNNVLIYISTVSRNSNHDPSQHPNYWGNLSTLANTVIIDNTTNTRFYRGNLIITHEDEVYLCTTNAQAGTNRNLAYVKANSGIGGEFVNLTDKIPTLWEGNHVVGTTYPEGSIVKVVTGPRTVHYQASVETDETPPHADWAQLNYPGGTVPLNDQEHYREWAPAGGGNQQWAEGSWVRQGTRWGLMNIDKTQGVGEIPFPNEDVQEFYHIVLITEAAYDALANKDPGTDYRFTS